MPKLSRKLHLQNEQKYLILILIINLLLRIPRVDSIRGSDAFTVLWMGRFVSEGYYAIWSLTPISIFGLCPFSDYPIGIPLLIGLFLNLGLSYETTVLIISLLSTIIGTVGAFELGNEILKDHELSLVFTLFYSLSPIFIRFTYFTISIRGPLLAVLPWLLLSSVRFIKGRPAEDFLLFAFFILISFMVLPS